MILQTRNNKQQSAVFALCFSFIPRLPFGRFRADIERHQITFCFCSLKVVNICKWVLACVEGILGFLHGVCGGLLSVLLLILGHESFPALSCACSLPPASPPPPTELPLSLASSPALSLQLTIAAPASCLLSLSTKLWAFFVLLHERSVQAFVIWPSLVSNFFMWLMYLLFVLLWLWFIISFTGEVYFILFHVLIKHIQYIHTVHSICHA